MRRHLTLILLLFASSSCLPGQIRRGLGDTCFSNFNNFHCVPIDGGRIWAWDMQNGAVSDCNTTPFPNIPAFVSGTATVACQPGTNGSAKGMQVTTTTGFSQISPTGTSPPIPNLPSGWTIASVFNPTTITGLQLCGILNVNFPTNSTIQYILTPTGSGNYEMGTANPTQLYTSGSTPITAAVWQTLMGRYTSATAGSAKVWYNGLINAGSWTTGTGASAIPAVQSNTEMGGFAGSGGNSCIGTIGFELLYDHAINVSAAGLVQSAMYRAMQFRGVAIP